MELKFVDDAHRDFYYDCITKTNSEGDSYREALFYALGINEDIRRNIHDVYDFYLNSFKTDTALRKPWQTGTSVMITRLAINLYNGYCGSAEEAHLFSPYELFCNPYIEYCLEAVRIRYKRYINSPLTNDDILQCIITTALNSKSDYIYTVEQGVLCIVDLDKGGRSVTNDIENVLESINALEGNVEDMPIIYRDSEGIWDAVVGWPGKIQFASVDVRDKAHAIAIIKKHVRDMRLH